MSDRESDRSASSLIAASAVTLGFGVITVALRFYARRRQKAALLADDWLTLPALATFIGACACMFFAVNLKVLGYSTGDLPPSYIKANLERSVRATTGLTMASTFCLTCTKASALFFYRRIFCVSGRKAMLNIIIIVTLVVLACWGVVFLFLLAFQCHTHFSAGWDGTQLKYCTLSYPALTGQAISDFILDLWVLVLPIYPISQLQTTKSRKFALVGIFLLACIGLASSIARMVIVIQLKQIGQANVHKANPQQYQSRAMFYYILEMGITINAINLPSIWMVFVSVAPDAILRSIRSVISLASLGSRGSKNSKGSKGSRGGSNAEHLKSGTSSSSIAPIAGGGVSAAVESHELGSHRRKEMSNVPVGQIQVSRSVEQTASCRRHEEV